MNEYQEIENINTAITNKSTTKKKKQLSIKTPSHSTNKTLLQSTGKEKFSVYEDVTESSSGTKINKMNDDRDIPRSSKKIPQSTGKEKFSVYNDTTESSPATKVKAIKIPQSSIPVPVTKSARVTRSRKP